MSAPNWGRPQTISRPALNADLSVYDRLGPKARAALREAPKDTNVANVVRLWHNEKVRESWSQENPRPLDPASPEGDESLACFILKVIRVNFPGFTPVERRGQHGRSRGG